MSFFAQYVIKRWRYLLLLGMFVLIYAATFALYRLPLAAVWYPTALAAILGCVVMTIDCRRVHAKHEELSRLIGRTCEEIVALPPAENVTEADYRALVEALRNENTALAAASAQRMDDMMDYYGTWAHQIKTPIAAMHLRLQNEDSELGRELSAELLRIEQYADMVMAYLRLDSASTDYVFRSHRVEDIVHPAIRRFAAQFIARRIRVQIEPLSQTVVTDEKWMGFVVEQVLSNALKYSPDGSVVLVYMSNGSLFIADEGIGIAPEDLPRVFEKGYTGANGRLGSRASGIGLYLCCRICDALGIGIAIESTPGQGTTVRLDLMQRKLRIE